MKAGEAKVKEVKEAKAIGDAKEVNDVGRL